MNIKYSFVFIICVIAIVGCSKETISPETFGSMEGQVFDGDTESGVPNVNITTTPPTNSIITAEDGSFSLQEIPTGQYTVTAKKSGYKNATVNVSVRESKTASAQIYLNPENENPEQSLKAEVTNWKEVAENDTTYADVEFMVANNSDDTDIKEYEVYFDIYTSGSVYSKEVGDTTLAAGERDIGDFRKYVGNTTIDSIIVSGTYAN